MTIKLTSCIQNIINEINKIEKPKSEDVEKIIQQISPTENDISIYTNFDHENNLSYGKNMIYEHKNYKIFIISWVPGDTTAIHNHGGIEWGCVASFGKFTHRLYEEKNGVLKIIQKKFFDKGNTEKVTGKVIHLMANNLDKNIISMHIYGTNNPNNHVDAIVYQPELNRQVTTFGSAYVNIDEKFIFSKGSSPQIEKSTYKDYITIVKDFYKRIGKEFLIQNKINENSVVLSKAWEKINEYLIENEYDDIKIVKYLEPKDLKEKINLKIENQPISQEGFLHLFNDYLDYSVRTGKKQFLNQLYSGFNLPAFIGEVFSALTNTSMYTYEVAPLATLIEIEMIKFLNSYTGYLNGDGTFLTGGSNANLIAMFSARNKILPDSRFEGYDKRENLTAFINEQAHYSFETAANVLGIGSKNIIKVKTDENGCIIPKEFEKEVNNALSKGKKPFFAVATCATTLLGAFDPIEEMAKICKKHSMWLHADGAFGGSLILSEKHKHLFKGLEKTDSFAWNPHKLMNIPLICSTLLVKEKDVLQRNLTDLNTDYLFHDTDKIEDLGKKSIQCGRKVDAIKLWFALKYYGIEGYKKRVENLIECASYAEKIVIENNKLELMAKRQSVAVCFRYISQSKRDLNDFNFKLREALRKSGKTLVNYGYIGENLTIRLVITNGEIEKKDIDLFFGNFLNQAKIMDK